jgi:hypothetical protein
VIGKTNVKLIGDFGRAMEHLSPGFGRIMEAAQPLVRFLGQMGVQIAKQFDEWTKGAKKSGALASFFGATKTTLQQLGRILGNLGHAFGEIFQSAYPLGHKLLSLFVEATHKFDKFVSSTQGKVFLASFFSQALPALKAFLGLVVDLGKGIITLASEAGPQLTQILQMLSQTVLPALVKLLGQLIQQVAPQLIKVLEKLLPILAKTLDAVGPSLAKALAKVIPVLARTFLPLLKDLVPLAKTLADAFKKLAPVINQFLKAIAPIMKGFAQQLRGLMQVIDGIITGRWSKIWKGVQNIFKGQIKMITGIFSGLVKLWGGIAKTIGDAIGTAFSDAWKGIKSVFQDVWGWIKGAAKDTWNFLKDRAQNIADAIQKPFDLITTRGHLGRPAHHQPAPVHRRHQHRLERGAAGGTRRPDRTAPGRAGSRDRRQGHDPVLRGRRGGAPAPGVHPRDESEVPAAQRRPLDAGRARARRARVRDRRGQPALPGQHRQLLQGQRDPGGGGGQRGRRHGQGALAGLPFPDWMKGFSNYFTANLKGWIVNHMPGFAQGGIPHFAKGGKWKPDGNTRKALDHLKATDTDIGLLDEQISNANTLSTAPDSPGGTDVTRPSAMA